MTRVDVLVFGPHPDDIEIGLGGTVAVHVDDGYRVGLCDLTRGELGSNGTIDERLSEAQAAAEELGVLWRENAGWPDGGIGREKSTFQIRAAAEIIRLTRPSVVGVPYSCDRHPDHEAACGVLKQAVFYAGLRRYAADGKPWKPDWTCEYFINDIDTPSFVVDVSDSYDRKVRALSCHRSQFQPKGNNPVETRLTGSNFLRMIEARDAHLGNLIGTAHAEGVIVSEPIVRSSLLKK